MNYFPLIVGFLLSITVALQADCKQLTASQYSRVDSRVSGALDHGIPWRMPIAKAGKLAKFHGHNTETTPVFLELTRSATADDLKVLERTGAVLCRVDGRALAYRRFVPAEIDRHALEKLLNLSIISHINAAPLPGPPPMDNSAELIGLDGAWGSRPAMDLLTGAGVKVVDIDSNADPFHPLFFKADAGYYDWIDVNGDKIFTPGVDAIDINGDADPANEVGILLPSVTVYYYYGNSINAHIHGFDPGVDWIYIDTNGNDKRDYGAKDGFDDSVPAFGEPLFVPDDVNQNGEIDLGERMIRLGTSKIAKMFVRTNYDGTPKINHVYERGVDLTKYETNITNEQNVFSASGHGSAVLSIIGGDNPLVGRRNVGIAPDADLMLALDPGYEGAGLTWALKEKTDVVLWERANWFGEPLDGTDLVSKMLDDSSAKNNITHVCPVGNCGGSRKHTHAELKAGDTVTLNMEYPAGKDYYWGTISINDSGAGNLAMTLTSPDGDSVTILNPDSDQYGNLTGGAQYGIHYQKTLKNIRFHEILLYDEKQSGTIPVGTWKLTLTEQGVGEVIVDCYLADIASGWGIGFAWEESIATDDRTIGIPAVSESCIGVGAHTGHPTTSAEPWFGDPEAAGEIRAYSGKGPTIDDRQKPDIAAPDNPWAAAPTGQSISSYVPQGAVSPFGGTSGAGPHVAGTAALLAQIGIFGDDARQAIRDAAFTDSMTGAVPNYDYGWGRLNAAAPLGATVEGKAPTVTVTVPANNKVGQAINIEVTATDSDSSTDVLEAKWDDDYDGTWDVKYAAVKNREVTFDKPGTHVLKVRVRDETGRFAEALALIPVSSNTEDPSDAGSLTDAGNLTDAGKSSPKAKSGCGCNLPGTTSPTPANLLNFLI